MDEYRNRGSPRLLFSKEELEKDAIVQPAANAEKAETQNDAARKKLKKRYLERPSTGDAETIQSVRELNQAVSNVDTSAEAMADKTDTLFTREVSSPKTAREGYSIRIDPQAPAVWNTRQRPKAGKNATGKAAVQNEIHAVSDALEEPMADPTHPLTIPSGKSKTVRLKFEEAQTKKPSRLTQPVQKVAEAASDQLHRQAAKANEDDNVAVDAVLQADQKAESALRMGEHAYHAYKIHSYRHANRSEANSGKGSFRSSDTSQQQEHPQFSSNPYSRWRQKRAIRQEYAAAKRWESGRSVQRTARSAEKAADRVGDAASQAAETLRRHPTFLLILALGGMLLIVMGSLQACTPLAQSVLESIVIGTYPAEEEDVRAAERAYAEKERALQDEMEHYERFHPGYDEYHVEADEIWHNPYVLIAIISAYYDGQEWDIDSAMPVIEKYFALQYEVTETVSTQTRYRTENGESVPYAYTICNVTLVNKDLSHLPVVSMSHHTMGMYALYMASHGNMEGIFHGAHATPLRDPMLYDIPQETLDADPTFARLMEEATKYVGYPYVWGGASPETSFDCSGFVSYVFTASGVYHTGRLGATGLRSLCRNVPVDQVKPGDIVFFKGTMGEDVSGITHCGIYVGNHMMIHCGSPLGYADLNDAYWQQHFHFFGRVPY